jgi:Leucine-rich repeat (LRR) protein
MNGENWTKQDNWLTDAPVKDWWGITVENHRVTKINFEIDLNTSQKVSGTFAEELWDLTGLEILNLSKNSIEDTIPKQINNLINLKDIEIRNNNIKGNIPSEVGGLNALTSFDLSGNRLTGKLPSALGNLNNLSSFWIEGNKLSGAIPSEIGTINSLSSINISSNQFDDLPDLSSLSSLGTFHIDNNNFTFGDLETAGISFSDLTWSNYAPQGKISAPDTTTNGNDITLTVNTDGTDNKYIWMVNNNAYDTTSTNSITLKDTVPTVYYCKVINSQFQELTLETKAIYTGTAYMGVIEQDFNALVALYDSTNGDNWNRNENWLSDTTVEAWHGVKVEHYRVTKINLSYNNLTDSIPQEIGDLTAIKNLKLPGSNLKGTIPSEIGNLTKLKKIDLGSNELEGTLPAGFGNLNKLENLDLAENKLNSLTDLSSLDSLELVYIEANYFDFNNLENSGIDWSAISSYSKYAPQKVFLPLKTDTTNSEVTLSVIDNHSNNYYQWIKNSEALTAGADSTLTYNESSDSSYYCKISNSNFPDLILQTKAVGKNIKNGVIKSDYNALTEIYSQTEGQNWKNNDNWLSDKIAKEWHGVTIKGDRVKELALGENNLTGELPNEIFELDKLTFISLHTNNLTGNISPEIGNLSDMKFFFCTDNSLSGAIPEEITNLENIEYLHLDENQFNKLPDMSSMSSLYTLFINNNCFDFSDLEDLNIKWSSFSNESWYDYAPQDTIALKGISTGSQYTFTANTQGASNQYAWIKNGNVFETNTTNTITVNANEANKYMCKITNEDFPELTLKTHNVTFPEDGHSITFTVKDEKGNTLKNAQISIGGVELTTDKNGQATLNSTKGAFDYTVSLEDYSDQTGTLEVIEETVNEEVTMAALEYVITFEVSDKNGNAIEPATISFNNTNLKTNEKGIATIDTVNGTYDYTVSANGYQDHENSVEINGEKVTEKITLSEIETGINSNLNNGFKIYPNPASEIIYLESREKIKSAKLMTLQGQIIMHEKSSSNITKIKAAQLESGFYLLQVKFNNNKTKIRQVIVR